MMGWAKSFAKPGGMITGVFFNTQAPKRFEVLKKVRPQSSTFGYLMNANNPATPYLRKHALEGARTIGIELEVIELKELSAVAAAFHHFAALGVGGVAIASDPVFLSNPALFAELALSHKLSSVGDDPSYAKAGGLISRSANYLAIAPRSTRYVDEILKGATPGDLAVELTVDYELTVNLKTARQLRITIPPELLAQATEVLE
jgi:putative ABC transport system substrate-binding protein